MKKLHTQEPYYRTIKNAENLLKHYQLLHESDYEKMRHQATLRLFPIISKDERILDVGCGGGYYSLAATKRGGRNIVAIDIESVCIKAAKLTLSRNAGSRLEGIVSSATRLPLRSGLFEVVLCIDLIEHVRDDIEFLKEVSRILNSEGSMLISTQNSSSLNYLIEAFFNRKILKKRKWMGWDSTHVRFYNPKSLFRLLRSVGFEITKVSGTYFLPYDLLLYRNLPPRLSKMFGAIRSFLREVNTILEMQLGTEFLRIYGWGIICLCTKSI